MKSAKHHIEIESGSTFQLNLQITEDDGSAYDLSGYSVDMQIRNLNGSLILDCEQFVNINLNSIDIHIPAQATASIADTDGQYQVEIKSGEFEYSVLRGNVSFEKAIIR